MQAYSKYKAYYDEKAKALKLKQTDYVFILQPKADHQGSKIPFTDFCWIGQYIIENVLPNNKSLERKIGTNKTQILHRMKLRQFTPRQLIPDIPITPREWQPDPEVVIKHDDLYARAWECEYDEPIFDSGYINLATPSSPEFTIRSEQAADEMRSTLGTIPKSPPHFNPQPHRSYDGKDMDHYTQLDADTSVEQLDPTPTIPAAQNTIYVITQRQIVKKSTDIDFVKQSSAEHMRTLSGNPRNVLWKWYADMRKTYKFFQTLSNLSEITIEHYRRSNKSFGIYRYGNWILIKLP